MSRGASSSEYVDPDLTAMLDVVMQLLMYFILCVNFVAEETSSDIVLPDAQSARPIAKGEGKVIILGIREDGLIKPVGEEAMNTEAFKEWLRKIRQEEQSQSSDHEVHAAIVVRAHINATYQTVFEIMRMCKDQGYRRFKLRANMRGDT